MTRKVKAVYTHLPQSPVMREGMIVLNQIRSGQVLITCCEPERITNIGKRIFVESGQIREELSCI